MELPPGLVHIARSLSRFIFPIAILNALFYGAASFQWKIPFVTRLLALLLVNPVIILSRYLYATFRDRREAYNFGAVWAPVVQEGRLSILRTLTTELRDGYPGEIFAKWAGIYGNIYAVKINDYRIFTTEPAHIKAILATQFEDFVKGAITTDIFKDMLGFGIFAVDGDTWKFHRAMARPFFNKERISDFEIFARHADETIQHLTQRLDQGHPVEFQDLIARFTLDSATEFLFGKSVESTAAGLPYPKSSGIPNPASYTNHPSSAFVHAFAKGQERLTFRLQFGSLWRLSEFWKNAINPHRKVVNDFVDPILREALARKDSQETKEHETFLSHLTEHTQDYNLIQEQLINVLVAGRDTTASTLTFAVYVLTQRPDIASRLREEIVSKVGTARYPTYQDIRDMKYLRAFINEVLRLYPIVPFDARMSLRGTTLPSVEPGGKPIYIPPDTNCIYSVFVMHRRTDLWGPDALEFDPDRFIDERLHKYLTRNPYIFVPFNAGPRICLGQQFAYNEASFFLVRLLQRFDSFSLASDAQPEDTKPPKEWAGSIGTKGRDKIKLQLGLTMMAKGGMWVNMAKAHNS